MIFNLLTKTIDGSVYVELPKEVQDAIKARQDVNLLGVDGVDGFQIVVNNPQLAHQRDLASQIMMRHTEALKELA